MAGSEVFDDVAFYYVATSFIGCIAIFSTLAILFNLLGEWVNKEDGDKSKSASQQISKKRKEAIGSKNLLRPSGLEPPPASRWLKKRYFFLIIAWIIFIKLVTLRSSMVSQNFATFEPYEILGLEYGAAEAAVRKAYRKLSLKWHPDQHTNSEPDIKQDAEEKFMLLTKAYYALTDPKTRDNYERYGNPDGANQGSTSMTYGLPTFLSNKKFEIYVLIGYLVLFVSLPVAIFYKFFSGTSPTFESTGVATETVQWFVGELDPEANVIEVVSLAMEFRKHFSSGNPTQERMAALKQLFPQLKTISPHKHSKIFYIMYGSVLFHAYLQRIPIPPECTADLRYYLEQAPKLHALVAEICRQNRGLKPFMSAIDISQCTIQRVWLEDRVNVFRQFFSSTFNNIHADKLVSKGITTLYDLRTKDRAAVIKLTGMSENDYDALMANVTLWPQIKLGVEANVNNAQIAHPQDILTIDYSLQRMFDKPFINSTEIHHFPAKTTSTSTSTTVVENTSSGALITKKDKKTLREERLEAKRKEILSKIDNWETYIEKNKPTSHKNLEVPDVVSNTYMYPKKEVWYLALIWFHNGKQFLVDSRVIKNFGDTDEPLTGKMLIQLPQQPGLVKYELHLRSDSYLGCDTVRQIHIQIDDPNAKLSKKVAEGKAVQKTGLVIEEEDIDTGIITKKKLLGPDDMENLQNEDDIDDEDDGEEEEEEELFQDDLDHDEEEPETYWYYLGGSSFWEGLANLLFMAILGFVIYHYCNQMAWWKRFVTPNVHKLWAFAQPYVTKVTNLILPHIEPLYYKLEDFLLWFLGEQAEMPIHIKLEKAFSTRGRIF